MEVCNIKNVSFYYPNELTAALKCINFSVKQGEFITICGKSGCGKTTLLRLLKPSLAPFGNLTGSISLFEKDSQKLDIKDDTGKIGFVFQNPEFQVACDLVWHELAFGLENFGVGKNETRARVAEICSYFGISELLHKKVSELSGGQKQLISLASVMLTKPEILILDEPTSSLDPISASAFLEKLNMLNKDLGVTVIICEHRLEELLAMSDRIIVMDAGKIIADGKPGKCARDLSLLCHETLLSFPTSSRVFLSAEESGSVPLSVNDGRRWLMSYSKTHPIFPENIPARVFNNTNENALYIKDVHFRYAKDENDVIRGLSLNVKKGEILSIIGSNGVGKSTLLSVISGLNPPYRGRVKTAGKVSFLPQNPEMLFVRDRVIDDLLDISQQQDEVHACANICEIVHLFHKHPYDLSGGERQRAALCKLLLTNPDVLLLDEPTKGMDAHFKRQFGKILKDLQRSGKTILIVSHDIEFSAEYSDRGALMFDGIITSIGTSAELFSKMSYFTTSAVRMSKDILPSAITCNDIISALGKKERVKESPEIHSDKETVMSEGIRKESKKKKISTKTLCTMLFLLVCIPMTIYMGLEYFGDRKYYLMSTLIMAEAVITFIFSFENRNPKAREIVTISVMCAIAVAGRSAFYMFPEFKPMAAIVIISGACLGSEAGFLTGVMSAFASNFFFGQGPWTLWQMTAFGLIGLISGFIFDIIDAKKSRINMCIFGFFSVLIIYGGILNPASVLMLQSKPTWEMLFASYAAGLPFDLIHAISTVLFLFLISEPFVKKLERLKIKFGIL